MKKEIIRYSVYNLIMQPYIYKSYSKESLFVIRIHLVRMFNQTVWYRMVIVALTVWEHLWHDSVRASLTWQYESIFDMTVWEHLWHDSVRASLTWECESIFDMRVWEHLWHDSVRASLTWQCESIFITASTALQFRDSKHVKKPTGQRGSRDTLRSVHTIYIL